MRGSIPYKLNVSNPVLFVEFRMVNNSVEFELDR